MLKKILLAVVATVVIGVLGLWMWWPENYAVKGPILDFMSGRQKETPTSNVINDRFSLPEGLQLGVYAAKVDNARTMLFTPTGDMLVASYRKGEVILLHADKDGDGTSDGREVLLSEMDVPYGLAYQDGMLYVAETDKISRMPFDPATRQVGTAEVIFDELPGGGNHSTRTLGFGPDGMLYVTVGSSCNVCIEDNPYRAAMLQMNPDGSGARIYATGLRNTVGFDWHPDTGMLYGTDNGRDLLGDDTPHCELNAITEGGDYGWPYAYDDRKPDPDFGAGNMDKVQNSIPMLHGFGAHRAPLGIRFISGRGLTPAFEKTALVALHGSWNRSELAGYKVVSLHFNPDGTITQQDFLTGFEKDEDVIGRPAEILEGPDGTVYISDDYSGTIFRVSRTGLAAGAPVQNSQQSVADPLADLEPADIARNISLGGLLYMTNGCAQCHDPEAAQEGVQVKLLTNLPQRYDVESLITLLETPPGPMPAPDVTDEGRRAIAIYLLAADRIEAAAPPSLPAVPQ
ncbi:hypothetical protein GCM10017044_12540 [Kordiimonas sediminis]|uniref:Cytochrome c domain-containing protein n=1 Tax=Kordiimonas sediminis TaxID=1735581 RepID=A0A919E4R9_9PROT|nr:PQQ-dependent sugar dehydrogenase [Kordiimonas sediminis]GHF19407.1 hypothetical protein GCM10017044_12540 [Kordiimonas sediminis]